MQQDTFRILVVDDDDAMREVCAEILETAEFSVETASDGSKALELLDQDWDAILTDINMPSLSGIEFYLAAIQIRPDLKDRFLFMTGDRASAETVLAMNGKLIKKPFRVKDLLDALELILIVSRAKGRRDDRVLMPGCGLSIYMNGSKLKATAEDISRSGMKIRYSGVPFRPGNSMGMRIILDGGGLSRAVEVVWSMGSSSGQSISGLRFDMPVSAVMLSRFAPQL